ncbi:MAG: bifunctional [glutamate--ammonia ligase]-adenylyl-L-tyrosine phosphorylase/[glutamate--ammonia-ligase] adenylyltransferase [Nitrospirota bacterium]
MTIDNKILKTISDAALKTSDPGRTERNLTRFVEANPDIKRFRPYFVIIANFFAVSQFLANYCIANPDEMYAAVKGRRKNITRKLLKEHAQKELVPDEQMDINYLMKALRIFKKRYLLGITIRDITGESGLLTSMDELSFLAETIISKALQWSLEYNKKRFGAPEDSTVSIIGLGKLGGEELNYSSDVDLIAVYDNDEGQTSGVLNPSGVMFNKISNHEFYCKTIELLHKLLSSHTEDGIAYRVDLRLRPQGQKGDITMPLKAYKTYYESWGRTWERMVLIRARPVAGDAELGKEFMKTIEPFVWKRTVDFSEIEEIRGLKKKIDSMLARDDIKRGYGGIREAEFFIQTFQLLYAGENSSLKSYRILNAIQALKWMNMVPEKDLTTLWGNYLYLRRVEHYLQMKEDLQTHTLPSDKNEMESLARVMGFHSVSDFLAELRLRRMQTKNMYNSLLGTQDDVHQEALNLLEGKLDDRELSGYLSFRNVKHPDKSLVNLKSIREHMESFRTMHERSITREVIPRLLENAFMSEYPDRVLAGLENLLTAYNIKTAHLNAIRDQKELMMGIIKIFSLSPYLTRIFLSSQYYLNILIEEWSIFKTLRGMEEKLKRTVREGENFSSQLAQYRRLEEIRLGILFLLGIINAEDLFRVLSHLAEAIIGMIIESRKCRGLSVIAFGKLGGREMTFGSDLDIVFVSETEEAATEAEKIMKTLTSYTDMGMLYSVDTRLRPDGSKGILVQDIEGYRNYYMKKAQNWEIQALLKARPVGGDTALACSFISMAKDIILKKGKDIPGNDISEMRVRIVKELSHESEGIDVKLGPGGIEEIEFHTQYLQLHHSEKFPDFLVQNTLTAIRRLAKKEILSSSDKDICSQAYEYFRKLETFQRLNEEQVITEDSDFTKLAATFMGHKNQEEFLSHLRALRNSVLEIVNKT